MRSGCVLRGAVKADNRERAVKEKNEKLGKILKKRWRPILETKSNGSPALVQQKD